MKRRTLIAVLILAVCPGACSRSADVRVEGSLAQPVARIADSGGRQWRRACVTRLYIHRGQYSRNPEWEIHTPDGECRWISSVAYGVVPEGFVEKAPPTELEAGVTYSAGAQGWTRGFASIPFYAGGSYAFRDGRWRVVNPGQ